MTFVVGLGTCHAERKRFGALRPLIHTTIYLCVILRIASPNAGMRSFAKPAPKPNRKFVSIQVGAPLCNIKLVVRLA